MDVAPPLVSSSSVAEALTPRQIGLILFALTLGGFAIGTGEFASMGLMPNMVASLGVPEPQALSTTYQIADQTVYHDAAHPSAVLLPLVEIGV